jgi:tetratricopeptide (TPR) repeat protein
MRGLTVVGLALVLAACGGSKDATPAPDFLLQARRLEKDGNQDAAIEAYRHALERTPDSFDAHYGLARALDLVGHYDEARRHFARAIDLSPDSIKEQTRRMMGIAWIFVGNVDEATRIFRQVFDGRMAAKNAPGSAEEANELGRVYLEFNGLDDAAAWYRTGHEMANQETGRSTSQIDLDDMRWAHAQARIAVRRGDEKEARREVAAAERLLDKGGNDTERIQLAYLRGYVEFHLGHFPAAIVELQKADQQDPFILYLTAEANAKIGQPDRAREYYQKVLASPSHAINAAFVREAARQKLATIR